MKKPRAVSALSQDPLWFKDAVIYEVPVKAFFDSNGDGIGDFPGLTQKLDYIQGLGVNTIWLLPFYPSPFRDDGYDIADYRSIHPSYGTLNDFRDFLRAAHQRGIRVITELVVNHTSDTHPWFQTARRAPRGSSRRNFYVWNDSDDRYRDARIIFTDTETSNWSWDPLAKAYYWHRFFSHQPDLNFDNPQVFKAIMGVMRFWLDMGVDGLRLDAIPYICEREATNCENLPETHQIIKRMRLELDAHYQNRVFLAEANQWPEDVAEYFANGDECHMAYHFPLMPRMYMALALEDRYPIVEIMRQTPEIPPNCQWAIFLRNHDELTLEMVTNRERDYMYETYAREPRAKLNLGIRRRLAPLLDNNRSQIELLNALLLSMPGSPILYYGDEIGMGDNLFLGDRNGCRTPMQWCPDRNGGFSQADPESLFLPPVMGPVYGFQTVNVEAQRRNPSSLFNWLKRLIAVRKISPAFGRGTLEFIKPANRTILAYTRSFEGATVLCVTNLSRNAQPCFIDLKAFKGCTPVEMLGNTSFPPIRDEPYPLTLPGHGFYWFNLSQSAPAPAWQVQDNNPQSDLPVLISKVSPGGRILPDLTAILSGKNLGKFSNEALPLYLSQQRWFAAKNRLLKSVTLRKNHLISAGQTPDWVFAVLQVDFQEGPHQKYFLPFLLRWDHDASPAHPIPPCAISKVRQHAEVGFILDAVSDDGFCLELLQGMQKHRRIELPTGELAFHGTPFLETTLSSGNPEVRRMPLEQSHTSVFFGEKLVLKIYRGIQAGVNPELEMGLILSRDETFHCAPRHAGSLEFIRKDGTRFTLGILQEWVENQGDGWKFTLSYLDRFLETAIVNSGEEGDPSRAHELYLGLVRTLGQRVGELHRFLAGITDDPGFCPEPFPPEQWQNLLENLTQSARATLDDLAARKSSLSAEMAMLADRLLAGRPKLEAALATESQPMTGLMATRFHGDLHLGQILLTGTDFMLIDFEGEPSRSFAERRRKSLPLRDVAGMLRSFSYAAQAAARRHLHLRPASATIITAAVTEWERKARISFLGGYLHQIAFCPAIPARQEDFDRVLHVLLLEKALYELRYEMASRPDWLDIPLRGLLDML